MRSFKVHVSTNVSCSIVVDAEDQAEAEELAIQILPQPNDWNWDNSDYYEVADVEELT